MGPQRFPLYDGTTPRWLFDRIVDLSGAMAEAIIDEYGRTELLRRPAGPCLFQAFGRVLGFYWHSSGVTTTTMGLTTTTMGTLPLAPTAEAAH